MARTPGSCLVAALKRTGAVAQGQLNASTTDRTPERIIDRDRPAARVVDVTDGQRDNGTDPTEPASGARTPEVSLHQLGLRG